MKTGLREYFCQGSFLAKGGAATSDEFSVKFQWGGEGVFFNPKYYIADFWNFKQSFLSRKLIKKRVISGFRVCFFSNCIEKNQNNTHFKEGTSESPPALKMLRKLIRFGDGIRP